MDYRKKSDSSIQPVHICIFFTRLRAGGRGARMTILDDQHVKMALHDTPFSEIDIHRSFRLVQEPQLLLAAKGNWLDRLSSCLRAALIDAGHMSQNMFASHRGTHLLAAIKAIEENLKNLTSGQLVLTTASQDVDSPTML